MARKRKRKIKWCERKNGIRYVYEFSYHTEYITSYESIKKDPDNSWPEIWDIQRKGLLAQKL